MASRKYQCGHCKKLGHNTQTCPDLYPDGKARAGGMWDAARWLAEQTGDVGYAEAGEQYGMTREAVRIAWKALEFGMTPREKYRADRREKIATLARAGKTASEIAEEMRLGHARIGFVLKKAGVRAAPSLHYADRTAIEAGIEIVRNGGTVGEGASVAGIQYPRFHKYMTKAGVTGSPLDKETLARTLGRGEQGALLVKAEGMTAGQAAMVVGCSPHSVRDYLLRHTEDKDGVA